MNNAKESIYMIMLNNVEEKVQLEVLIHKRCYFEFKRGEDIFSSFCYEIRLIFKYVITFNFKINLLILSM